VLTLPAPSLEDRTRGHVGHTLAMTHCVPPSAPTAPAPPTSMTRLHHGGDDRASVGSPSACAGSGLRTPRRRSCWSGRDGVAELRRVVAVAAAVIRLELGQSVRLAAGRACGATRAGAVGEPGVQEVGPHDRELSGIPTLRPHQFRHTYACRFLERGETLASVQSVLGHSTVVVTQRYAKLNDASVRLELERAYRDATGYIGGNAAAVAGTS
jgi:hypothetical protein